MNAWTLGRTTWRRWRDNESSRAGAALAFYALFGVAPLLLTVTAVVGLIFGTEAANDQLQAPLEALMTPPVAQAVQELVASAGAGHAKTAGLSGLLASGWALTRGFMHLQATLNNVFGVRRVRGPGALEIVRHKALAFGSVGLTGLLLLLSVVGLLLLQSAAHKLPVELSSWVTLRFAHELGVVSVVTILLVVVFGTLPDVRIQFRDLVVGALVSAVLFRLGQVAIALYLGRLGWGSSYGAAGSLVAILLYVYYSAQVLLFGANFTAVWCADRQRPPVPSLSAALVTRTTHLPGPADDDVVPPDHEVGEE